jgi:hypothetical protein
VTFTSCAASRRIIRGRWVCAAGALALVLSHLLRKQIEAVARGGSNAQGVRVETRNTSRGLRIAAALISFGFVAGCGRFLALRFPFRQDVLLRQLPAQAATKIEIGRFTENWVSPGFSADKVHLSDRDGDVITVDRIVVRGSYAGLLSNPVRLTAIDLTGLRVWISPRRPGASEPFGLSGGTVRPKLRVDEIRLDQALLDLPRDAPGRAPLEFAFHSVLVQDLGLNGRMQFSLAAHNPVPSGEVHIRGEAGPIGVSTLREMPMEGQFTFENANLTAPRSISGLLNASGNCRGTMGHLECAGTADVPQFQVFGSAHAVHIASRYQATVDAVTGNARLNEVVAHFNSTTLSAVGTVSGDPDPRGKTLTLDLSVRDGRLEDLLTLFTSAPQAGMRAAIGIQGRFIIPPGPPDFLSKLRVDGKLVLSQARFTNPASQTPLDRLSASAEGVPKAEQRHDPRLAAGNVQAHVTARNGVANLREVAFAFPGIQGRLAGTFSLHEKQVHLDGAFETQGKLSDTSSGLKALLLKAIGPLWPKTDSMKSIPFAISGRGSSASFHLRLHPK